MEAPAEGTAETTEETTTTAEGETGEEATTEEGGEVAEGDEAAVEGEGEEVVEEELFLPGGEPSRPHQNIFTQGAYNWDGAAIYSTFTEG